MGLPGHRRTSSHKRRRASHFALKQLNLVKDNGGKLHLSHRPAPDATEYRGHAIHIKGQERKLEKLLRNKKTAEAPAEKAPAKTPKKAAAPKKKAAKKTA